MDKKVTKEYRNILKESKKLTKNILYTILNTNKKEQKLNKNGDFTYKLIITREQKDDLKRLAHDFLIDGLNYDDLTNKQLAKSIIYAFKGNYTKIDSTKMANFYDFKECISVMDFWRNVGWQLKGLEIVDKVIIKKGK